jgi:hypothetical protein
MLRAIIELVPYGDENKRRNLFIGRISAQLEAL